MKKCPSCDRTYPDTETFCETDGTAFVGADPAFVQGAAGGASGPTECPVCGGKAEPGEVICNFCGARLTNEPPSEPQRSYPVREPSGAQRPSPGRDRTVISSQPLSGRFPGRQNPEQPPEDDEDVQEGSSFLRMIAYVIAALIALIGGAWLAITLTAHHRAAAPAPSASASPSSASSITAAAPMVTLATSIAVEVTGESASAPERNVAVAKNSFANGRAALLDAYSRALAADSNYKDGMLARIRIEPNGTISKASVVTSTAPNPGLDADVVNDMSAWTFAPFSGGEVEITYPLIFAQTAAQQSAVEAALAAKIAGRSPGEAPEYSSATPSPVATPVPAPPSVAPSPAPRKRRRHVAVAPAPRPRPAPSLYDRVNAALKNNRKLGRVQAYTSSGGVVTLSGRVFDNNDKALAERTVRAVSGVTSVVDTLTTDTSVWAQEQATIQQQLANAGLPKVTVKVIGNDAYLDGTVKTELDKQRAVTITEGAAPVRVRGNVITVVPGNMFGF